MVFLAKVQKSRQGGKMMAYIVLARDRKPWWRRLREVYGGCDDARDARPPLSPALATVVGLPTTRRTSFPEFGEKCEKSFARVQTVGKVARKCDELENLEK
jgi:hypothetical protein